METNKIHIIRWEEIPDFPLYVDQVLTIINESLSFLNYNDDKNDIVLTNTMVNNYIKHGIVEGPSKKKYTRIHVAYLISVTLLKQVYALDDIMTILKVQTKNFKVNDIYNDFCETFENYTNDIESNSINDDYNNIKVVNIFNKIIKSVVYKIYVEKQLDIINRQD